MSDENQTNEPKVDETVVPGPEDDVTVGFAICA